MSTSQNPSLPASPELPESVRQEVEEFLITDFGYLRGGVATYMKADKLLKKLTPLWPSADGRKQTAEAHAAEICELLHGPAEEGDPAFGSDVADVTRYLLTRTNLFAPTPSPVAGLPTPETDQAASQIWDRYLSADDTGDADPVRDAFEKLADFARSLERRLAAAESRINELTKLNA